MTKIIKSKTAFSLAEVLVTMLVVSLVMVMMAPIFTKKTGVNSSVPPGEWTCTLDASGRHVASDGSVAADGSYCIFKPRAGITDYSVYAVGGGGGGAAGNDSAFSLLSFGASATAEAPETGTYNYMLVGGGGGGASYYSISDFNFPAACNGAAGSVKTGVLTLTKGSQIHISAGYGGEGGHTDYHSGGYFTDSYPIEIAAADKGGDSTLTTTLPDGDYIETAAGGAAGDRSKKAGSSSCASAKLSQDNMNSIVSFTGFPISFVENIGRGGAGSQIKVAASRGINGMAMVKSILVGGGGGGNAGTVVFRTVEKPSSEVIVKVGKGGEGGSSAGHDGNPGQPSAFGNYVVAAGGSGGKIAATLGTSESTGAPGEASPFGGVYSGSTGATNAQNDMDVNNGYATVGENMYGAGGGGGGYEAPSSLTSGSTDQNFGKGGRGASGMVRVEWH